VGVTGAYEHSLRYKRQMHGKRDEECDPNPGRCHVQYEEHCSLHCLCHPIYRQTPLSNFNRTSSSKIISSPRKFLRVFCLRNKPQRGRTKPLPIFIRTNCRSRNPPGTTRKARTMSLQSMKGSMTLFPMTTTAREITISRSRTYASGSEDVRITTAHVLRSIASSSSPAFATRQASWFPLPTARAKDAAPPRSLFPNDVVTCVEAGTDVHQKGRA